MKKHLLIIGNILLVTFQIYSQVPDWTWSQRAGESNSDYGYSVATDYSGNLLVTGFFLSPTITFGTTTLTNAGNGTADIFTVKYDNSGNFLWAIRAGGSSDDRGLSVATDRNGNIFVVGTFQSGSLIFGTTTLTNVSSDYDTFIVKYDSSGNVLWAKSAGGSIADRSFGVATDGTGNAVVTGSFNSAAITFGTITLTNISNFGYGDIFTVKYDSSGNVLWANSAGGSSNDGGNSITTDGSGNVFVTGNFLSSTIAFGTTVLTNDSAGFFDIFTVKYDASGIVLWAKSAGGTRDDVGRCVSIDENGNVIIAGYFSSPGIILGTTALTNTGGYDTFIAKYDSSGNVKWAKSAGGNLNDQAFSVVTESGGNSLVTGVFASQAIAFGTTNLINDSVGSADIFIVKYDSSGNVKWAKSAGGSSTDQSFSIAIDGSSNLYITGAFYSPTITFGATTLTNVTGNSYSDVFIARLNTITGIEEQNNSFNDLIVFPNPATNSFTIKNTLSGKNIFLEIVNTLGKIVYSEKLPDKMEHHIQANLGEGFYFVRVSDGVKQYTNKLIIRHY